MYPSLQLDPGQGIVIFSFGGAISGRLLYVKSAPANARPLKSRDTGDNFMAHMDLRATGHAFIYRASSSQGKIETIYSRK